MNFVIVGTNFICDTFLQGALITNEFNFYGLCSRKKESAQNFLNKYKNHQFNTKIFNNLDEVCSDKKVDAIYIASPNSMHAQQAIQCLNAKKHVLGEKPSAANNEQLQHIINTAKQNDCLYMEAFMTTLLPNFSILKQQLTRIGKLRKYIGQYSQYSSRYQKYLQGDIPNWCKPEFANGALVDLGIYPLGLLLSLWGVPENILARGILLNTGVDGAGDLLLSYSDKQAVISFSKINHGDNISEFQGELGRIEIKFVALLTEITLILNNGAIEKISLPLADGFMKYELAHFIQLIQENKKESPINSYSFSTQLMTIMDEARHQMGVIYPSDN